MLSLVNIARERPGTTMLTAILTSPASSRPMDSHQSIDVIANLGIAGDRYATGKGFYSGVSE